VWGRRAVYHLGGVPLLVSEFFLPRLVDGDGT
jgi:chorismate-pyruvate lyase